MAMRIVIIGDIHLYDLSVRPWQLVGKRLLGQINLWMRRRHVFNPALIKPVLTRAMSLNPDWLIFSGDLTTTARDSEFAMAAKVIRESAGEMLERGRVLMVPGNHDRYTFTATHRKRFEAFMGNAVPRAFPHTVVLTPQWRMIGIDSCCPRLVSSRGRVGRKQLAKLATMIDQTPQGVGLVVVCHYPMMTPPDYHHRWSHQLADARELAQVVGRAKGPVVFVHGHIHRPWQWVPESAGLENVRMINAGSPCMTSSTFPAGQGFWAMDLPDPATETQNQKMTQVSSLTAHRPIYDVTTDPAQGVTTQLGLDVLKALSWRVLPQDLNL